MSEAGKGYACPTLYLEGEHGRGIAEVLDHIMEDVCKKGKEQVVTIHQVDYAHKSTLRNLLELYKYDFSEFDPEDVNENGRYEYKYLDHYWTEEGRYPYFIRVDGMLAGLALVRGMGTNEQGESVYAMAEFFVMKKYRSRGVGRIAATELFDRHRGIWRVAQIEANIPAQLFWTSTIARYTQNQYEVTREDDWEGPIHVFSSKAAREGE